MLSLCSSPAKAGQVVPSLVTLCVTNNRRTFTEITRVSQSSTDGTFETTFLGLLCLQCLLISFVYLFPVNHIPECINIFRSPVLIFKIICMLPNIKY